MDIRFDTKRQCNQCGKPKAAFLPHFCVVRKASPVADVSIPQYLERAQTPSEWAPKVYGEYYATSNLIYSAVKLRADSLVRATLRVYQTVGDETQEADDSHPLAELLHRVNDNWTLDDLIRATSTYRDLWGSAYWALTKPSPEAPPIEIWPMRPDRVRVIADRARYIKGYIYISEFGPSKTLRPDEVIWARYFNPLDEFAGMSPIAPTRIAADTASDAMRHNRNVFKNGLLFGSVVFEQDSTVQFDEDSQKQFYQKLKERYAGPDNSWRPLIAGPGMKAQNLGLSQKDMEFMASLRWSLEEVARAFQIPPPLLQDFTHATYANVDAAERMFWRNTIVPELRTLEAQLNEMLVPLFKEDGLFVQFDISEIEALQDDVDKVAVRDREDIKIGLKTINQVRNDRGDAPVAWGDVWWAPVGIVAVDSAETPIPSGALPTGVASPTATAYVRRWQKPVLDQHGVAELRDLHLLRLARGEPLFTRMQRELFAEQHKAVLQIFLEHSQKSITIKQVGQNFFDIEMWSKRFATAGFPIYGTLVANAGNETMNKFGFGIAFDVKRPAVRAWLDKRVALWSRQVNEETAKLLVSELDAGRLAGENIAKLQERINTVFDFNDKIRTERIARTEVQSSANHGALEAYRQSGVVDQKQWIATLDDRTRDAHAAADGQRVAIDDNFIVGGEALDSPGDGSPENAINCRCAIAPVISPNARALPSPNPETGLKLPALTNGHAKENVLN